MTPARIALAGGALLVVAFFVLVAIALHFGFLLLVIGALVGLIACGNLLYGRHNHGIAAVERTRDAQEAHDRIADEAADHRRALDAQRRQQRRAR